MRIIDYNREEKSFLFDVKVFNNARDNNNYIF